MTKQCVAVLGAQTQLHPSLTQTGPSNESKKTRRPRYHLHLLAARLLQLVCSVIIDYRARRCLHWWANFSTCACAQATTPNKSVKQAKCRRPRMWNKQRTRKNAVCFTWNLKSRASRIAHKTRRAHCAATQEWQSKQAFLFQQRLPLNTSLPSKPFERARCPRLRMWQDKSCLTQILESRASRFTHETRSPRSAATKRWQCKQVFLFQPRLLLSPSLPSKPFEREGVPGWEREKTNPVSRGSSKARPVASRKKHEGRAVQQPSNYKASRSFYYNEDCHSAHHCHLSHPSEQTRAEKGEKNRLNRTV